MLKRRRRRQDTADEEKQAAVESSRLLRSAMSGSKPVQDYVSQALARILARGWDSEDEEDS
jgi:hypothetical protein